jgi:hypothetical protein
VSGSRRKLLKEEFHNLYFSSNIIRIIKLRTIIWTKHVAGIAESRKKYTVFVKILKAGNLLIDLGMVRWIILK